MTADIEHPVRELTNNESRLRDTSSLDTGPKDILVVGHVVGGGDTGDVVKVAGVNGLTMIAQHICKHKETYYLAESLS